MQDYNSYHQITEDETQDQVHRDPGVSDDTEVVQTPIEEHWSYNQNYKACIFKESDTQYRVQIYQWNEEATKGSEDETPVWESIAGPFILESLPAAQSLAMTHLPNLAGENLATDIDENISAEIQAVLGHENFDFLEPSNFKTRFLASEESEAFEDFDPHQVLIVDDFYYVKNDADEWWAGFLFAEGEIRCWKKFPNLGQALLTIRAGEF